KRRLDGVQRVPYLVFHDAYHYLEARYGLNAIGSITVNPGRKPGARRISEIRQKIAASGARCIFSEPQFSASVTAVISDGFNVKTAVLDPMGAGLASGPEFYFELMRNLAASLVGCLGHEGVSGH
ncbi:MAG TPA: zinc ABC transporter substrate-binding protein, partial [Candidatus Tenderia sp.]|nr:zinc ABC transporter substrate-binding protein [Candidatus Tenderia sp.]